MVSPMGKVYFLTCHSGWKPSVLRQLWKRCQFNWLHLIIFAGTLNHTILDSGTCAFTTFLSTGSASIQVRLPIYAMAWTPLSDTITSPSLILE